MRRLPVFSPPATYGECCAGTPTTGSLAERLSGKRQCMAFACRANLLGVPGRDVPGRRTDKSAPEPTLNGESATYYAPSCAIDVANRGPRTSKQVAEALGTDKRRAQQLVKAAVLELKALGVNVSEMLALLERERAR